MRTDSQRWTGRSKGGALGYRFFIGVMRAFGVRAAYALLYFVVPWYILTSRRSNAAMRGYFTRLRAHVPGIQDLGLFGSYMAFGRNIIDKVAVQGGLGGRYTWDAKEDGPVRRMLAAGKGGVLISAHAGNWELASHIMHGLRGRMSVVLHQAEDAGIRAVIERNRSEAFDVIPLSDDLSHVVRMSNALREGRVLCIHGDRALPGARLRKAVFLGAEAWFPAGPFALAAAHKVPVCIAFVVRTGPMRYTFTSTEPLPPGSTADAVFERYVRELERITAMYPLHWFNYYDFWHHADPDRQR